MQASERVYSNPDVRPYVPSSQAAIEKRFPAQCLAKVHDAAVANWELERSLVELWERRLNPRSHPRRVADSLVFPKIMIGSPGMLETVHGILKASRAISPRRKPDDPLPAVLVVGSPGAGKEKVSGLVPVFTSEFWDAKRITLNMATVHGLGHLEEELRIKVGFDEKAVVFWDELNSLDATTQGGVLRILELGQFSEVETHALVNWLVVGMVNEDPAQLTLGDLRERTRDTLIFGGLKTQMQSRLEK